MTTNTSTMDITFTNALRDAVDGVFVIDRERRVVFFSDGCERITGVDRTSVIGTACACHELTGCRDEHGRSLSGALCPSVKIFHGEIAAYRQRMEISRNNGPRVWVETTYSPIRSDDGDIRAVLGVMRDISETKEREDELRAALSHSGVPAEPETAEPGAAGHAPGSLDRMLTTLERREIVNALQHARGQRTLAARLLGISRSRLYRRMEALGIDPRSVGVGEGVAAPSKSA